MHNHKLAGSLQNIISFSLLLILFFPFFFSPSFASAKNLEMQQVIINAEVLPDGSVKVEENRTIYFDGSFSGAEQKFYFTDDISYHQILVREGDHIYTLIDNFPTFLPDTYAVKVFDDYFILDWSFEAHNEERTFTLEYEVENLVIVHDDVAELYYKFIGDEWEESTNYALIQLVLPHGADQEQLRAWGHGPLHGKVTIQDPQLITWEVYQLPGATFLESRATFPVKLVPEATRFSGTSGLTKILMQEKGWAILTNLLDFAEQYQLYYSPLLLLLMLGYYRLVRRRAHNRINVYNGNYFRELPGKYSPAVLGYLWRNQRVEMIDLTASILDLALRQHLRIEEISTNLFSYRKSLKPLKDYRLIKMEYSSKLERLDKVLLKFLFETVAQAKSSDDNIEETVVTVQQEEIFVTLNQITDYCRKNPDEFYIFYNGWLNIVKELGKEQNFYLEYDPFSNPLEIWGYLISIFIFISAILLTVYTEIYILAGWAAGCAVLLFFLIIFLPYSFTEYGADQYAKWKAFRRFLLHFSQMDRSTIPSLSLWEHYLVYAVALGVAPQVIRQMAIVFPELNQELSGNKGVWTGINTLSTGDFDQSITAITHNLTKSISKAKTVRNKDSSRGSGPSESSRSSGSGSGGGFSRGGGGGSGGGGGRFR